MFQLIRLVWNLDLLFYDVCIDSISDLDLIWLVRFQSCGSPSEKEALRVPSALISLLTAGEAGQGGPDRNQLLRMLAEFFQTARARVP